MADLGKRPDAKRRQELKDANNIGAISDVDREVEDWARRCRLRGPMVSAGAGLAMAGACATLDRYRNRVSYFPVWQWLAREQVPSTAALRGIARQLDAV